MPAASLKAAGLFNFASPRTDFLNVITRISPDKLPSTRTRRSTARLLRLVVAGGLAVTIAMGCGSRGPSKKEQARANWNAARASVLLNLGNDQFRHGNFAEARKTSDEALKLSNRVPGLFVLRAKLDIEDGELQSAATALTAAKVLSPRDPEPFYLCGVIAERWQQPEQALAEYQGALERKPDELAYMLAVAETMVTLERAEAAAELLEAKLHFFESSAPLRDLLGQVYEQLDRPADAAEMYRQAAVLAPEDMSIRERHALSLAEAGDWRRSAELLERLLDESDQSRNLSLHMALAECRMELGNYSAARAAYQRAARLDERSVAAWLGVGKAALADGDVERAATAVGRAEALRPAGHQAADAALLRGYIQLKQNDPTAAAHSFAAAGRAQPKDAMPIIMYGYCQQLLGRPQDAERFYRLAAQMDPNEPLAGTLMRALASGDVSPIP